MACLQWQRRLRCRWEYYAENFLSFVQYSSFGLFVLPISAEDQLSRKKNSRKKDMNTAMILLHFIVGAPAPILGRMLER